MDAIDQNLARIRRVVDSAIQRSLDLATSGYVDDLSQPRPAGAEEAEAPVLFPGIIVGQILDTPLPQGLMSEDVGAITDSHASTGSALEPVSLHRRVWAWFKRVVSIKRRPRDHAD